MNPCYEERIINGEVKRFNRIVDLAVGAMDRYRRKTGDYECVLYLGKYQNRAMENYVMEQRTTFDPTYTQERKFMGMAYYVVDAQDYLAVGPVP